MKFLKSLNITGSIYIPMSLRWTSRVSSIDDRGIINHFDIQDSVFNIRYSLFNVFHIPQSQFRVLKTFFCDLYHIKVLL